MSEAYVFLDTNVLLHFKRPDQINWLSLCDAQRVYLVIYPLLMSELTKAKDERPQKHLRARAQTVGSWLRERLRDLDTPIRTNVFLFRDSNEPRDLAAKNGLDWQHPDDRIIAHAIRFKDNGHRVFIATNDGGLEMKLPDFNIAFLEIDETQRLAGEEDPDKLRADRAERELRELRTRLPVFNVKVLPIELKPSGMMESVENFIDATLADTQTALTGSYGTNPLLHRNRDGSTTTIYDQLAADQLHRAKNYLMAYYRWLSPLVGAEFRTFTIENLGNGVATNVRIRIRSPSGVRMTSLRGIGAPPERPLLSILFSGMNPQHASIRLPPQLLAGHFAPLADITVDASGEASFVIDRIAHKEEKDMPLLFLRADLKTKAAETALEFQIFCDELAQAQKSHVPLKVAY